jgi:PAS domain S-box-containing protein
MISRHFPAGKAQQHPAGRDESGGDPEEPRDAWPREREGSPAARDARERDQDAAAPARARAATPRDHEAERRDDAVAAGLGPSRAWPTARASPPPPHGGERAPTPPVGVPLEHPRATSDRAAGARHREASRALMSAVMLSAAQDHASATADEDRLWEMSVDLLGTASFSGFMTRLSASWEQALGYTRAELMSRPYLELVHPSDREHTAARTKALVDGQHPAVNFENRYRAKDGSYRWFVWSARTSSDQATIYFVVRDVTGARSGARELYATLELVRQGFENAPVGMLVTNPGGAGVVRVNRAMRELTGRTHDQLLACESFADLMHSGDAEQARAVLALLSAGALESDEAEERLVRPDGSTVWVLRSAMPLRDADGVTTALFVQALDISEQKQREETLSRDVKDVVWIERIREAIDDDRFLLYAQPIIALATREVVQHELLLRMRGPWGDLIQPWEFLPVAEKYGMIEELDAWVISRAVTIAARGEPVEVNLSGMSIGSPRLLAHIERELGHHDVHPAHLVFEITETALMENIELGERFANRLTALGCRFALDDFGTGFGSFTYLKRLSARYLKIDIEFVRDLRHSEPDRHVIKAIVALATGFGQETIAEGVEDEETLVLLRELGVDFAQGFHIGRPALHPGLTSP